MANVTRDVAVTKSAYIRKAYPTTHYGTNGGTNYLVGTDATWYGAPENRLLFGLGAWPASLKRNRLISAKLRVYVQVASMSLYASMRHNFDAESVTWNTQPDTVRYSTLASVSASTLALQEGTWSDIWIDLSADQTEDLLQGTAFALYSGQYASGQTPWYAKVVLAGGGAPYLRVTYSDSEIETCKAELYGTLPNDADPTVANSLSWTLSSKNGYVCFDDTWTQSSAKLYWRVSGTSTWKTVSVSGSITSMNVPANTFPAGKTIEYYVAVTETGGATVNTETATFTTKLPTLGVTEYPTGTVDSRTAKTWKWSLHFGSNEYTQASAKFFWRVSGATNWNQINVSGNTKSLSVAGYTFPAGETIEWYLTSVDKDGNSISCPVRTFGTSATVLAVTGCPSGNEFDARGNAVFTWTLKNGSGDYTQSSAKLYWKLSTDSTYTAVNVSGNTKTVTVPGYTFRANSTIQWYLSVTDADGAVKTTSVASFKTQPYTLSVGTAPSGSSVDSRAAASFAWTIQNVSGAATQASAVFYWRVSGASSYTAVSITGGTKSVSVPAYTFPQNTTIQWYVSATVKDGTVLSSSATTFKTQAYTLAISTAPSGSSVDSRAAQSFAWTLRNVSGDVPQTSAKFYWRVQNAASYTAVNITGATKSVSIPAYTFPQDTTIQWYVSVTAKDGAVLSSSAATFKTQAFAISITASPSGSNIDTRSAIVFSWKLANSSGDVPQTSAKFYWRVSGASSWTQVSISGSTKSVSIPANTFPTGKTIQWYVVAVAQGSVSLTSSTASFTTVSPKVTADTYPSGSAVYTAAALKWTWHLASNVGNYSQKSAKLYWRTSTAAAYTAISVSGNTQALSVPANTFPTNATVQWYLEATDTGGLTSTTSVMSFKTVSTQITPQSSPVSGYMDPRNAIVFQWYFASTGGSVPQGSASLYWRVAGASAWTQVQASGSTAKVTIPANTFPVASTIQWYIAGTDIGGTSSESQQYSFSTAAETAYAYPQAPIGISADTSKSLTLRWILKNADGTQPSKVTLQWKRPTDVSWTTIRQSTTAFTEWTVAANYFPVGEIEWRVIATNRDSVDGPEGTAAFISVRAPNAPVGLSATAVPRTTVSWQGQDQEAYEIIIDGETVATAYGTATSWQPDFVLEDGTHVIAVRIQGPYGYWSDPAITTVAIENVVPAALAGLSLAGSFAVDAELRLGGAQVPAGQAVNWFRDGKRIAESHGADRYRDRYVLGEHAYRAEVWDSSGYYARTETVTGRLVSCITRIAPFEGGDWLDLKLSDKSGTTQSFSYRRTAAARHVLGAKHPVLEISGFEDVTGSYDVSFMDTESAAAFEALKGRLVIIKSRGGNVLIGALLSLGKRTEDFYIAYSFTVEAADWEDFRHVSADD